MLQGGGDARPPPTSLTNQQFQLDCRGHFESTIYWQPCFQGSAGSDVALREISGSRGRSMSGSENPDAKPDHVIARHRYLDILHQFTLRQANLSTLDDIVWNIAKTAIAELGFEDCVVYLVSDDGAMLKQVAAHGTKNPVAREIFNEITIPVGAGIVGHVAQTGEVQCVADARLDSRYITDDDFRLSELAVPITHAGRIIGVLDSEHPSANFFSDEDIQLFTTIAALASNRIETALAMERLENTVERLEKTRLQLELQAEELRESRLQAEAASVAKSNFLANMSHEIRTPMTAIVGFAELLAAGGGDDEEQSRWRGQLTRNASYLQDLIGNILDMSEVEKGLVRVENEELFLRSTVIDSVETLRARAKAKALSLDCQFSDPIPEKIIIDRVKLREIIVNLVSNAIKYTDVGAIKVGVSAERGLKNAVLRIAVSDTGIGIDESQLDKLFVPFSRVHDTTRLAGIEGTGLGLALTYQFVKAMDGEVSVSSKLGQGSEFVLTLPCGVPERVAWSNNELANPFDRAATSSSADLSPSAGAQKALLGLHILCCEDSDPIALLLEVLLTGAGAQFTRCINGAEGIERFEALSGTGATPDLVLMDMQMPVMDGYQATAHLKQVKPDMPVIALTAFALKEDVERCRSAGCDHYLTKPIQAGRFASQLRDFYDEFRGRLDSTLA